jgi:hypothetical protein
LGGDRRAVAESLTQVFLDETETDQLRRLRQRGSSRGRAAAQPSGQGVADEGVDVEVDEG